MNFYGVSCNFSPFLFMILLIWAFSLFSWWAWLKICQFCLFFKEPAFSSLIFFLLFFSLYFIYFYSDLDFLPLSGFCLFLILLLFCVKLGCLFEVFLVSWGKFVLFRTAFAAFHRFCIIISLFSFVSVNFFYFLFDFFSHLLALFFSVFLALCFYLLAFFCNLFLVSWWYSQKKCLLWVQLS